MIQRLALLFALIAPGIAMAQSWKPDRVYVPLASENWYGTPQNGIVQIESNENNFPGILASYEDRLWGLTYSPGFYRSSNNTMAAVLNVAKRFEINEEAFWGPTVSLVQEIETPTGQWSGLALNPILPSVQILYKNFFANGLVLPTNEGLQGRITFGLTFEIN